MGAKKLDAIDKKILSILQDAGKTSNVELAQKVGITAPPCLRRVKSLEQSGYIDSYHANINAKALGYTITAFVLVGLSSNSDTDLSSFENKIKSWPLVRECYLVNGEYDFILKIVTKDLTQYQEFLTGELTPTAHVSTVKTAFCVRTAKNLPGIPID